MTHTIIKEQKSQKVFLPVQANAASTDFYSNVKKSAFSATFFENPMPFSYSTRALSTRSEIGAHLGSSGLVSPSFTSVAAPSGLFPSYSWFVSTSIAADTFYYPAYGYKSALISGSSRCAYIHSTFLFTSDDYVTEVLLRATS